MNDDFELPDPENRFDGLPLLTEMNIDGNEWKLMRTVRYRTEKGERIIVPRGFVFDYASVPTAFGWIYPKTGCDGSPYSHAALIHDWLYCHRKIGSREVKRKEADDMLYEVMRYCGCSWFTSARFFRWVRAFGWIPWGRRKSEDIIP